MNIDYAKIITTANERKEKLQALGQLLESTPEMLGLATELLNWVRQVEAACRAMDREGKELLPRAVGAQLSVISASYLSDFVNTELRAGASDKYGLVHLEIALRTAP